MRGGNKSVGIYSYRQLQRHCHELFCCQIDSQDGKKAKLLFSWDEFDRMRKVPVNVAKVNDDMEKYIGCPYVDVPNPFPNSDAKNYAEYFEKNSRLLFKSLAYRWNSVIKPKCM